MQALDGVTVLDCATFVAAPFCCTLLGEFGATVIKIEQPGIGDDLRRLGRRAASGQPDWWLVESRNKKSITCNLRAPEGQALLRRLAATADVLAENFRPGTMERWGLGWDDLHAVNRRLVMVRISAFGQTGPARERPGFGRIAAAVSGAAYLSGHPDRPPVSPGTPTIPDYLAGVFGAFGALIALRHRDRSGEGQVVDVGLYEPMLRMLDELVPVYGATGYVRERIGSATEYVVPHNQRGLAHRLHREPLEHAVVGARDGDPAAVARGVVCARAATSSRCRARSAACCTWSAWCRGCRSRPARCRIRARSPSAPTTRRSTAPASDSAAMRSRRSATRGVI